MSKLVDHFSAEPLWDEHLIKKYDRAGPRYTSYPTALQFTEIDNTSMIVDQIRQAKQHLSLYLHIPFCSNICYYCGCNKVVTKRRDFSVGFIEHLKKELSLYAPLLENRIVEQMHWGGGTPTFLDSHQLALCFKLFEQYFNFSEDGDYAIEIDPRTINNNTLIHLRKLGFNRVSFGVQDFNPAVQKAVNRVQSFEQVRDLMATAKQLGFKGINVDLIYGLPLQNTQSFSDTLDKVIELEPSRLSLFNYAHMPTLFKPQRRINEHDLPAPAEKLAIFELSIKRLRAAGYHYIGMDHFAHKDDSLTKAQQTQSLHRNFQGYSTHKDCDLIGFGPSAISSLGQHYYQNAKTLNDYYQALDKGELPIKKLCSLDDDDLLRRAVINQLICHFKLEKATIEQRFTIDFDDYFKSELIELESFATDGLIELDSAGIRVNAKGRVLIRVICAVFDRYLREREQQQRYSKVI